ncbi:MAG TPA: hypothetical protein V6D16_09005 [Candidatus Obscuribacterales bacterium]
MIGAAGASTTQLSVYETAVSCDRSSSHLSFLASQLLHLATTNSVVLPDVRVEEAKNDLSATPRRSYLVLTISNTTCDR